MSLPFRFYFRVRYAECDAQKVVFNARYGDYVDLGFTEFLRALGYASSARRGKRGCQPAACALRAHP